MEERSPLQAEGCFGPVWTGSDQFTCPLVSRYHVLVSKYGTLAPLAEVEVRCGERVEAVSLRLQLSVAELKQQLSGLLQLPPTGTRLFHTEREPGPVPGPRELCCGSRALQSYGIRDGDQILVVPSVDARCSSSGL